MVRSFGFLVTGRDFYRVQGRIFSVSAVVLVVRLVLPRQCTVQDLGILSEKSKIMITRFSRARLWQRNRQAEIC